ncbi:MAG: hypothetical protein V4734_12575 [Terriglobus sp.]
MDCRDFLRSTGEAAAQPKRRKPNIILYLSDLFRWDYRGGGEHPLLMEGTQLSPTAA